MRLRVTVLMDPFQQSIAEAQMALLTLETALLTVEGKVFLINPIASRLTQITIQGKGYDSTARAGPGLGMCVTVFLSREYSLAISTFVVSDGMGLVIPILDLERWKPRQYIIQGLDGGVNLTACWGYGRDGPKAEVEIGDFGKVIAYRR